VVKLVRDLLLEIDGVLIELSENDAQRLYMELKRHFEQGKPCLSYVLGEK